jgi:hypothetical protein
MVNKFLILWFLAISIGCGPTSKVRRKDSKALQKGVQVVEADAKAKAEAQAKADADAKAQTQAQVDAEAKAKAEAERTAAGGASRNSGAAVKTGSGSAAGAQTSTQGSADTSSQTGTGDAAKKVDIQIPAQEPEAKSSSNAFRDALSEAKKNVKPIPSGKPAAVQDKSEAGQLEQIQKDSAEKAKAKIEALAQSAEKKESVFKSEEERNQWTKLTEYIADLGIPQETPTGLFFTVTDQTEPTSILRTGDFVVNTQKTRGPNETKVHQRVQTRSFEVS